MAAFHTRSSTPESIKAFPKQRHSRNGQRARRPRNESSRSSPSRGSPTYQIQREFPYQIPTPISTPSSSALSLTPPLEHGNGITMERTHSGNSILSDKPYSPLPDNTLTLRDEEAARRVSDHFRQVSSQRRSERSKHERILRRLIRLDHRLDTEDGEIDDKSLAGIVTTADSVFFGGALAGRVQWDWSSEERYQTELIGTTALRHCADGNGIETLIVLSEPILKNPQYDRRLLLSAFLHELVHCYLFIQCGFEARIEGGHTPGFHTIARIIDDWVGGGYLSLCNMKANLSHFRRDRFRDDRCEGRCNSTPRPERGPYGYT
ncbi:hypothetical protein LHYA1_G003689 [Lachnellula hyalina]|uniref:SprT-like domain-containing protein n=1 Tax=Lachnellula hyalina TaxID=1316788 RepID=A0A8H8U1U7_9HELO|nr:uncharacterized protein LHYA1_G003689 [Lachnellula hyalina]TVY28297.1 hypothetical protein LHYA1_G003689 [Lachnellula hyalina]